MGKTVVVIAGENLVGGMDDSGFGNDNGFTPL